MGSERIGKIEDGVVGFYGHHGEQGFTAWCRWSDVQQMQHISKGLNEA
jgi:hypothetical protein